MPHIPGGTAYHNDKTDLNAADIRAHGLRAYDDHAGDAIYNNLICRTMTKTSVFASVKRGAVSAF